MTDVNEAALFAIAGSHMEKVVGYPASDYHMEYRGLEDGLHSVKATHKDDLDPKRIIAPGGGSGKSRWVMIDPESMTVKAALREQ